MGQRNVMVEGDQRTGRRRQRIAVNHDDVGLLLGEHLVQPGEHADHGAGQGLPVLHHGQVVLRRRQFVCLKDLVELLPVLTGADHHQVEPIRPGSQRLNDGRHFGSLGPGSKDHHDLAPLCHSTSP
jgi:hypothetical protein